MSSTSSTAMNCATPLMANPSGAPPNFTNFPTLDPVTISVGTILLVIAYTFVGLRVHETFRKERRLFADDYLSAIALVFVTAYWVLEMINRKEWGHLWDMNMCIYSNRAHTLRATAELLIYYPAMACAKASICLLYIRLFESVRWIRYASWTILVIFTMSTVASFILVFTQDVQTGWADSVQGGVNTAPSFITQGTVTVLVDLTLLSLPVRPIMQLTSLTLRKRIALLSVFLTGAGATVCTIILLVYMIDYYYFVTAKIVSDWPWLSGIIDLLSAIELTMNIILGCVPAIVAAWRNTIRDSTILLRIEAILGIQRKTDGEGGMYRPKSLGSIKLKDFDTPAGAQRV